MTREEHLLVILSEECAEVIQRIPKILRFGLHKTQDGQCLDNAERLNQELVDLFGVYKMLLDENILLKLDQADIDKKTARVNLYLERSKLMGRY